MPLYMISYDDHPTRDYKKCYELMTEWDAKRVLESLWFASLDGTADQVVEAVDATFADHASVAVVELFANADWCTMAARKEGTKWLQDHIRS